MQWLKDGHFWLALQSRGYWLESLPQARVWAEHQLENLRADL
ncbi:MAG: hypothetical protein RMN51_06075 [Verrucomicrobiota bacterium]|nr:hypothetical protein [Verrucomicrobiota bacterium]